MLGVADGGPHRDERQLAHVGAVDAHRPSGVGSRRASSIASVVLPEPVRPTMASDSPGATERLTSSRTLRAPYAKLRCST